MTKRRKPNFPPSLAKRLRQPQADRDAADRNAAEHRDDSFRSFSSPSPSTVMVSGLPLDCTVLELKSHLEMYGTISRIRLDPNCFAYVNFRSDQAAEAAIAASLDPALGITIGSAKLLLARASDPVSHWRQGVGSSSTPKFVRAEKTLIRHDKAKNQIIPGTFVANNGPKDSYTKREIRAYDDLF